MVTQLAGLASAVINSGRQFTSQYLAADCNYRVENMVTQTLSELDPDAALKPTVPYEAVRNVDTQYFLETQGLCANLHVRRRSVTHARFVLGRATGSVLRFDGVLSTRQPKRLRPQWDGTRHLLAPLPAMVTAVNPAMCPFPSYRMCIVAPDSIAVNENALAWTILEMLDGGDRNHGFHGHRRLAP